MGGAACGGVTVRLSQACVRELAEAVEASNKRKSACHQRRASSHTKVPHVIRVCALQGKGDRGRRIIQNCTV